MAVKKNTHPKFFTVLVRARACVCVGGHAREHKREHKRDRAHVLSVCGHVCAKTLSAAVTCAWWSPAHPRVCRPRPQTDRTKNRKTGDPTPRRLLSRLSFKLICLAAAPGLEKNESNKFPWFNIDESLYKVKGGRWDTIYSIPVPGECSSSSAHPPHVAKRVRT